METLQIVVLVVHTLIALLIIGLVLLQRGKGADAGAAFGAGASGTVFGARGSTSFLSRATALLATAFFISSLTLAYISSQHSTAPRSLLESAPEVEQTEPQPADDGAVSDMPSLDDNAEAPATNEMPLLEDEDAAPAADEPEQP